ncbi:MAG TPA: ABC transporter permease subunit [Thermoanaerobaculia bacterium]|nr:ABC transporter permease subunit [Thermoanaerobaculia bacterium]
MNAVVIRETFRRHVTHAGYISVLVLIAILGIVSAQSIRPATFWPGLVTLLAVVTGCGIIGPEFSSGTLQLILVKPVNRSSYLLSRVTGVLLVIWLAALTGCAAETLARLFNKSLVLESMGIGLVNVMAETLLIVSLLTLLGSITRAYFNVAIFYGLQIALAVGAAVLRMSREVPAFVLEALAAIDRNLFPDVPPLPNPGLLLLLLSNAAVALLLACLAFNQREVPYGAD